MCLPSRRRASHEGVFEYRNSKLNEKRHFLASFRKNATSSGAVHVVRTVNTRLQDLPKPALTLVASYSGERTEVRSVAD